MKTILLSITLALTASAEIRELPGGKPVPHDQYLRVVSETESPVERVYIQAKDGLYIAAAIRKPKGDGPFPAFIQFHGAPGGQGMETLVRWARGETGGPMWERYLQEDFVVVVADYRGGSRAAPSPDGPPKDSITRYDDAVSVVEHVRALPYVDGNRIGVYGGSLGGDLVLHLIGRIKVQAAGVGAPAAFWFLGIDLPPRDQRTPDFWKNVKPSLELARKNIDAIQCPLLIQTGSSDSLLPLSRIVHDLMVKAGKPVRLEIYADSPHGFYFGRLRTDDKRSVLNSTLGALDSAVAFIQSHTR